MEEEEGFGRGKSAPGVQVGQCRCLRLSFWAAALLDVAPLTSATRPADRVRRQPFPAGCSQVPSPDSLNTACQCSCPVSRPSTHLQFLSVFHDGANEIPRRVFPLK